MPENTSMPPGLAPPEKRYPIGDMPNDAHQPPEAVFQGSNYTLIIVEFDDQGRCQDRQQMHAFDAKLAEFQDQDTITLVFVHGWKHDGRSDDDNLTNFCGVLQNVAAAQSGHSIPVIGIFVAWRGLSLYGYGIENLTFWDRKQAGLRVAMGAPHELFGRLRQYRRTRLHANGSPLLLIIGHSFGGMIVYAALAQSLIEAAATQTGHIVPSFADLVLLVNPAFEAVRYMPVYDLVKERGEGSFAENQLPVFVSVTAQNDWATGLAFPAGMAITLLQERVKGCKEFQALIQTMGHLGWMQTHELATAQSTTSLAPAFRTYGQTVLKKIRFDDKNPFWVVTATKDVIDGHNGIWLPTFADFVQGLVTDHAREAHIQRAARAAQASVPPPVP
jgi:pimeloyl-ACP methyl ester carboxylesterase